MKKNNDSIKEKIQKLAKELMFDLSDEQIDLIESEYSDIEKSINSIKNLNLDNIEPTSFIQPLTYADLNNDEYEIYDQKDVFKNSSYFKNGMVEVNDKK